MSTIDIDRLFYPGEVVYNNFHIISTKPIEELLKNSERNCVMAEKCCNAASFLL